MAFTTWLKKWKTPASSSRTARRRPSRTTRARTRLKLEALEDRTLPTVTITNAPFWGQAGPAPILGEPLVFANPDNSASGAVETAVVKNILSLGPDGLPRLQTVVYAGTVHGGVWRSDNIRANDPSQIQWRALTDDQPSLAVSSLALDPLDRSGNVLWVGTGPLSSNIGFDNVAREAVGLLRTQDGGRTWTQLGKATLGGQRILRVVPAAFIDPVTNQQDVLVACGNGNGVMWSNDGGMTFQPSTLGGVATDLVEDPNNPVIFYAAVAGQGIFESTNSGRNWFSIGDSTLPTATSFNIKLAVANNGGTTLLYAAIGAKVPDFETPPQVVAAVAGVFQRSVTPTGLAIWSKFGGFNLPLLPTDVSGAGAMFCNFLALTVDPTDPNVVYVGAQGTDSPEASTVTRVTATDAEPLALPVINPGGPHPDCRSLTFLDSNTLLETDDGGIYSLSNFYDPNNPQQIFHTRWVTRTGNLADTEFFSIAYDTFAHIIFGGTQDNGTPIQLAPNDPFWAAVPGPYGGDGDGGAVGYGYPDAHYYYADGDLRKDGQEVLLGAGPGTFALQGLSIADQGTVHFANGTDTSFPIAVGADSPLHILFGGGGLQDVYVSYDGGTTLFDITNGTLTGMPSAFSFGTDDPRAVYVATQVSGKPGGLYFGLTENPTAVAAPGWASGVFAKQIVVNPSNFHNAYLLDSKGRIWETFSAGATAKSWVDLTDNLLSSGMAVTVDHITLGPGGVLLASGRNGVFRRLSSGIAGVTWSKVGLGLPNVEVTDLEYVPPDPSGNPLYGNLLLAGTYGRGAWEVLDADGFLSSPSVLQVNGDEHGNVDANDHIVLQLDPNDASKIQIIVNGQTEYDGFFANFNSVIINGGGGDDTIDIHAVPPNLTVSVTENSVGSVNVGDSGNVQNILGKLVIADPGNYTILTVDDSADVTTRTDGSTAGPVTVSALGIDGLTPREITYGNSLDYLLIKGGTGTNNFQILGTPQDVPVNLSLHGQDTVNVADSSIALSSLSAIRGSVDVIGNGKTTLFLNDQQHSSSSSSYTVGTGYVQTDHSATIGFSGLASVVLNGAPSANYDVDGTAAGTPAVLDTNTGTNTINVTPHSMRLTDLGDDLFINGKKAAPPTVNIYNGLLPRSVTGLDMYTITATFSAFNDPRTVNYSNVAAVNLYGGGGTYDVLGIPTGATYTVYPGPGPNAFSVVPGLRNLVLNGLSTGPLTFDDSSNPADATYTITTTTVQVGGSPPITYTGSAGLIVKGGRGNDTFNVQGTTATTPVTLIPGAGNNTVKVSPTDRDLTEIQGGITIQGQGRTTAVVNDQNDFLPLLLGLPNIYTVTSSTVASRVAAVIHFSGLDGLTLNGDDADDLYDVESTAQGNPVTINTGVGTNSIGVTPASKDLTQIQGGLTIHGHGQTTAVLDDRNDIIPIVAFLFNFYSITNSTVANFFSAPINYTGLSGLTLDGDISDDVYYIESTAAGTPVTVNTGPGTNEVDVTPTSKSLANLRGGLVIQAPPGGKTTVNLDDSADAAATTYTIIASSVQASGSAPITYANVTALALKGGSGTDVFKVQGTAAATPVTLVTGSGANSITVAGLSQSVDAVPGPLTVNAQAGTASVAVNDQATTGARTWTLSQGNLTATAAGSSAPGASIAFTHLASLTVNGGVGGNTFNVQGTDAGTAFTLKTGTGNDTVNLADSRHTLEEFLGTLTVNGQAGSDALNIPDQGELDPATQGNNFGYHTEDDTWSPAGNGLPARVDFFHVPAGLIAHPGFINFVTTSLYWQNFQQIAFTGPVGGSTATHDVNPNALVGTHLTLAGGTLNDTLFSGTVAGQQQTFTVTGHYAGTVGNITYTGVVYLLSFGAGPARFKFLPGGFESALNGDGSPATLDLSAFTPGTTVVLPYFSGPTYNWGSVPGVVQVFASMTSVVGTSGDTLVGGETADTWSITGKNSGQVGGVAFSGFPNLTGGGQPDTFAFAIGGQVTGVVNGGGGVNGLDYSGYPGNILVDLPLGQATAVGGGVQNIRNVAGGQGTSLVVGNGAGNTLTGGAGRSVLIAGGGPGILLGGPGDDILVGGTTAYDRTIPALNAIMAEWARTDLPYAARVNHLLHGGGLNGATLLNPANFTANAGGNTLTGAGGLDLFYGSVTRDANDWDPGIGEVFVGQDGIHASTRITVGGLSMPLVLDGTVSLMTNSTHLLTLTPGNHTIRDATSGDAVTFTVSDIGAVSYIVSLEGVLSGVGTGTLTVNGRTVVVDASALSVPQLLLDVNVPVTNPTPLVFTALPGPYTLWEYIGSGATVTFTVNPDGTVGYVPSLEGILTGATMTTLYVKGRTVTIDATAQSLPAVLVENSVRVPNTAPFSFTALPAPYSLIDFIRSGFTESFTLNPDGTVDYEHSLDGMLSGRSTTKLTLLSAPGDMVLAGTDDDDTLNLTLTPGGGEGFITYVLNGGAPVALGHVVSFKFLGMGGNDSMIVSLAGGAPLVPGSVSFDGGTGLNALTVDAAGLPVRTTPGTLVVGGQAVGYTAVGTMSLNNAAGVNAAAGPDTLDRATAFAGLTPAERAVQALFLDALGRAGSVAELDLWVALLPPGAASLSPEVVQGIETSAEARDHLARSWYLSYLGRPANGQEEQPYVNLLANASEEQALSSFLSSDEFYARAQSLIPSGAADERYVQALFLDLLSRTGSSAEVAPLVNVLSQVGRAGIAQVLLQSAEFRTDQFEGYFNALLHRPDTPGDAGLLGSLLQSGIDLRGARLIFEASAEFFAKG